LDLNGLISTIISSTAALVAIIGGFLVSRVISLSSEKNSIVRRLREINNDLKSKKELLNTIEIDLLEDDIDSFINEYSKEIIIENKPFDELLEYDKSYNLTVEQLKPYIVELLSIRDEIINLMDDAESLPEEFNDFIRINGFNINDRIEWYELVYQTLYDEIMKSSYSSYGPLGIKVPTPPNLIPARLNLVEQQIHRDKIKEFQRLQNEIEVLKVRKDEQEKILNDYAKPNGLWGGFFVLIYSCVVGIAYPSTLLPYPKDVYNDELTQCFLLVLFFSQLIVLFLYLGIAMYRLTKNK
jgi:hypothetical protein